MMRELRVNDVLVIAVDHGYGNIKGANVVFSNGFEVRETEPLMSKDYIYYDGRFYVLNQGYKSYQKDKVQDDDFYILTVAAIAKELYARGLRDERIHLAVGLPLKWIDAQNEEFKEYLMRNLDIEFQYKGEKYHVQIEGCSVMPQCYAGVVECMSKLQGAYMVADIGNGTMNVMCLQDGQPIEKKMWTEILGMKQCALRIHAAVLDAFQEDLSDAVLNAYLTSGTVDIAKEYLDVMNTAAKDYVREIFQKLRELGYNDKIMKLHIMGGGANLVELFGEYDAYRVSFNLDICANAKGFEMFCYIGLRHNIVERG